LLKSDADREELKQALGKTVIEMHTKCDKIQAGFLKLANESGRYPCFLSLIPSDTCTCIFYSIIFLFSFEKCQDFKRFVVTK